MKDLPEGISGRRIQCQKLHEMGSKAIASEQGRTEPYGR
jgi:hypothetical protein